MTADDVTSGSVVLPRPALRTGFPRTAAQLAAAGLGVAVVPFSALTPRSGATVRSLDPPELRDVVVIVAAPHDGLLRRFAAELNLRGLPAARLSQPGPASAGTHPAVVPSHPGPVAAYAGSTP